MSHARVVFWEDGEETEAIVPNNWIVGKKLFYPTGASVVKNYERRTQPDKNKWLSYDVVAVKVVGDEELCKAYEFTTTADENSSSDASSDEEESQSVLPVAKIPLFPSSTRQENSISNTTVPVKSPAQSMSCTPKLSVLKTSVPQKRRLETPENGKRKVRKTIESPSTFSTNAAVAENHNDENDDDNDDDVIPLTQNDATPSTSSSQTNGSQYSASKKVEIFPMENKKFQKLVINILSDISRKIDNLSSTPQPSFTPMAHIPILRSLEDLKNLDRSLTDDKNYTSFVRRLSNLGGKTVKKNVKNVMDSFIPNATQSQCNMQGNGTKLGFEETNIYRGIVDAILASKTFATTSSEIKEAVQTRLKHAPKRTGGGES